MNLEFSRPMNMMLLFMYTRVGEMFRKKKTVNARIRSNKVMNGIIRYLAVPFFMNFHNNYLERCRI